jgi:hypothetical protein
MLVLVLVYQLLLVYKMLQTTLSQCSLSPMLVLVLVYQLLLVYKMLQTTLSQCSLSPMLVLVCQLLTLTTMNRCNPPDTLYLIRSPTKFLHQPV